MFRSQQGLGVSLALHQIIIFLICSASEKVVIGQDPWETPLDELISVQDKICRDMRTNWSTAEWSKCIDPFIKPTSETNITIDEFEELRQSYTVFCRDPVAYKKCWKSITNQLNRCDTKRGDTSTKLYFAVYDNTCRNFGKDTIANLTKALEEGYLCELDYLTKICNETKSEWQSKDICRRYRFQRLCEESVIENCDNDQHKGILLRNLEETGKSLGCIQLQDPSSTISSLSVSNLQTKNIFSWPSVFSGLFAFIIFV